MKVLVVDLETEWRGGQNQALLLLKGLIARGHQPELLAVAGSALEDRASISGISVHMVERFLARPHAALQIRALTKKTRYDIVHVNEPHALTSAWLGGVHRHTPLVVSRRVGYPISKSWLARLRYQAAARIIAISRWSAVRAMSSGIPENKIAIVNEGVEIPDVPTSQKRSGARTRWGIADDTFLLGCVGVLSPDKGQEYLIRALAAVRRKHAKVRLILAGDGPCRQRLEALTRDLGLTDAVIFAGFVAGVEEVYVALDLFLLPSFFEALSNALMLAMAYAVPSIAFNCGGPAEIIEHGKSGLLVEPGDAEVLSASITTMLGDSELTTMLGKQGRKRIQESFSVEKMVRETVQIYMQCRSELGDSGGLPA